MWRRLDASRCSVIMLPELKPDLLENVAVGSSAKVESCENFGGTAWVVMISCRVNVRCQLDCSAVASFCPKDARDSSAQIARTGL